MLYSPSIHFQSVLLELAEPSPTWLDVTLRNVSDGVHGNARSTRNTRWTSPREWNFFGTQNEKLEIQLWAHSKRPKSLFCYQSPSHLLHISAFSLLHFRTFRTHGGRYSSSNSLCPLLLCSSGLRKMNPELERHDCSCTLARTRSHSDIV